MQFKSSILSENGTDSISMEILSNRSTSYLENMMEFTSDIHQYEVQDDINLYRALTESAIAESNGSSIDLVAFDESFIDSIANAINRIIEFVKKFVKTLFGVKDKEKIMNDAKKGAQEAVNHIENDNKTDRTDSELYNWISKKGKIKLNVYTYPDIKNLDTQKFRACLNNIISVLDSTLNGRANGEASDKSLEMAYATLGKLIRKYSSSNSGRNYSEKVNSSSTFKELVKTEICFVEQRELSIDEYLAISNKYVYYPPKLYASKAKEMEYDLENARNMISRFSSSISEDQMRNAKALLKQVEAVVNEYTWFTNYIYTTSDNCVKYTYDIANKMREPAGLAKMTRSEFESKMKSGQPYYRESGSIHGEPFNSDTLFANEDENDFNRTEWLDLQLTAESYEIKYNLLESYKHMALQEAMILTDDKPNKFARLVAMREAEGKSIKEIMKDIFDRIRELFKQFITKIKNSNVEIAKYIQKNKEFIDKPVKINASSAGDILAGMYRIQQKVPVVPFNYETMKEDLKDKNVFFEKHILQSLKNPSQYSKRKVEWSKDMTITEYCKAYYGASMPESKYPKCEFTTQELQANMANILKFEQTYNGSSFNNDINAIENESKKIPSLNAASNNTPVTTNQENMYYSSLYGTWFNELQVEKGDTQTDDGNKSDSGNANNKNDSENDNKNKDIDEATAFKTYTQCYNDVFLSKLTATEFIANEFKSFIIAHAESYMNEEQKKASRNMINNKEQVNNKPATENK